MEINNDLYTKASSYLKRALNDPSAEFREGQFECIEEIMRNKRVLAVQRTGYGKSMIYFLATRLLRDRGKGPTLLISPLLSLMRNQIEAARNIGVNAASINSTNNDEFDAILSELKAGKIDLLLVSPERLNNERFKNQYVPVLSKTGLLVIDEAHCISDWGHDFRPDYRRIVQILKMLPSNIPVLATTATANNRVVEDIKAQIGNDLIIQRGILIRDSLKLQNITIPSKAGRMAWLAEHIPQFKGSGIVYTMTRKDAENLAAWLQSKNIAAEAYYAIGQQANEQKRKELEQRNVELEQKLLRNEIKVLVATVALGMGFDKPDLAFVIHFQRPASVVHYYQQVGRAGRGVTEAYGILLHGKEDDDIADSFLRKAFPPRYFVDNLLKTLSGKDGYSINDLQRDMNISKNALGKALKWLLLENNPPVLKNESKYYLTPWAEKYRYDQEAINKIIEIRKNEQKQMQEYMDYSGCLMSFLRNALDDPSTNDCGKCKNCVGHPLIEENYSIEICNEASDLMKRTHCPISPRKKIDFKNIPPSEQAQEGRALSMWNDAGWGEIVANGKYKDNNFSDKLVTACYDMILEWFKDQNLPAWVACVPSLSRPLLVANFAERLAQKLHIPFVPCVKKIKQNRPQKEMENSLQQYLNVKDVFDIQNNSLLQKPCFLIDDVVASRWTFTVISRLLCQKGCPKVYPLALAQNTTEVD